MILFSRPIKPPIDVSPPARMPEIKQSEPTGWEHNLSGQPYGLPYFIGEKVSVTFGRLRPSYWYEHSFNQVRLVFTFNNPLGLIEITRPGMYREPSRCLGPHAFWMIPPRLETTLDWTRRAELVVLYVDVPGFVEGEPSPSDIIIKDFRPLARRDPFLFQLAQMFLTLCCQSHLA